MRTAPRGASAAAVLALTVAPLAAFAGAANAAPADEPQITVSQTDEVVPGGTVTVEGSGLDPDAGYYVATCVVGSGGPAGPSCAGDRDVPGSQLWVSNARGATTPLNADGTFTAELDLVEAGTSMSGEPVDCAVSDCAVTVFYDHRNGFGTVDAVPVSFAAAEDAPPAAADEAAVPMSAATDQPSGDGNGSSAAAIGWGIGIPVAVIVIGGGVVAARLRMRPSQEGGSGHVD